MNNQMTSNTAIQMTIAQIVKDWYLPEKRARRRRNTVEGYESSLNLHVLPTFGGLTLPQLEREDVQVWVDSFSLPGAAAKAYKCLRQVVRWAIRKWALLLADATLGVELPRRRRKPFDTLTARALTERIRGFWGHRFEPTVILASALGLRPGEAYALNWTDIGFRDGSVRVTKSLQQVHGAVVEYPTKTEHSDRTLYLPRWATERLRDLWRALGKPKGRIIGDFSPAAVAGQIKRYAKRMGLPKLTMQNARHTWATLAREAGVPLETVSMVLGHSSTVTAYQHYIRPTKRVITDAQKLVAAHMLASS